MLRSSRRIQSWSITGPAFGNGGVVLTNLGIDLGSGVQLQAVPSAATLLRNGDIVVGGSFGLARYLPNGQLDTTFGTGGVALTASLAGDFAPGLAVQPDGKYLLVGAAGSAFGVVRFNADGSVDQSFGNGGLATRRSRTPTSREPTRYSCSPTGKFSSAVSPC